MGTVTKDFREMYDYLQANRPDVLEWCKEMAKWHRIPLGAVFTFKEEQIKSLMAKKPKKRRAE